MQRAETVATRSLLLRHSMDLVDFIRGIPTIALLYRSLYYL